MKNHLLTLGIAAVSSLALSTPCHAQINLGDKLKAGAAQLVQGFTISNEDAAALSLQAVQKMDKENPVAPANNPYAQRLNRVFGPHAKENGMTLNFKVYLVPEVNAFATADGSVRVFKGLMDLMDDNQLLAVIGHEIGHVANEDSKDAMRRACLQGGLVEALASQSDKVAALTDSQYGQIGQAILTNSYSRKQESEADTYSYDFMKRHGYNVNAVESAFLILAKMSQGEQSNLLTRMLSTHPDPQSRADKAHARAVEDGLYKPYSPMPINNGAVKSGGKKAGGKKKGKK